MKATPLSLQFDLTSTPIPPSLASSLPTHLRLHHHADGAHAGYTLDDVFFALTVECACAEGNDVERVRQNCAEDSKDEDW